MLGCPPPERALRSRSFWTASARVLGAASSAAPGSSTTTGRTGFSRGASGGTVEEGGGGEGDCDGAAAGACLEAGASGRVAGLGLPRHPAMPSPTSPTREISIQALLGSAIAILQPDDIMELRRRDLDDVAAVFARDHPMPGPGRDVVRVPSPQEGADQDAVLLHHQLDLAV